MCVHVLMQFQHKLRAEDSLNHRRVRLRSLHHLDSPEVILPMNIVCGLSPDLGKFCFHQLARQLYAASHLMLETTDDGDREMESIVIDMRQLLFHTEQTDLNSIHKTKERTALCGIAMSVLEMSIDKSFNSPYLIHAVLQVSNSKEGNQT